MFFEGAEAVTDGQLPLHLNRPGTGLTLRTEAAERFQGAAS